MLALLTTCGSAVPRGSEAKPADEGTKRKGRRQQTTSAPWKGELVNPSDYPTDEALSEMVDNYEALLCWLYLPEGMARGFKGSMSFSERNDRIICKSLVESPRRV